MGPSLFGDGQTSVAWREGAPPLFSSLWLCLFCYTTTVAADPAPDRQKKRTKKNDSWSPGSTCHYVNLTLYHSHPSHTTHTHTTHRHLAHLHRQPFFLRLRLQPSNNLVPLTKSNQKPERRIPIDRSRMSLPLSVSRSRANRVKSTSQSPRESLVRFVSGSPPPSHCMYARLEMTKKKKAEGR